MFEVQKVTPIDIAFGAKAMELMPKYDDIPKEYKHGDTKWNKLFNDWFFIGLLSLSLTTKPSIDKVEALAHLQTIMGSFEPPHEHKEAGIAFLMSEWFEDAEWTTKK